MKKIFLWFWVLLCTMNQVKTQDIQLESRLLQDTVQTGEYFKYVLKVSYPINTELFFPDSADTKTYQPLVMIDKIYAPTNSNDSISTDSVIYRFACFFENDSVQKIQLPVYILKDNDTLIADSKPVFVHLKPKLKAPFVQKNSAVKLSKNLAWRPLRYRINYPYLIAFVIFFVAVAFVILLTFGGRFRRTYRLRRLKRRHERFINEYNQIIHLEKDTVVTEHGLSIWKTYIEDIKNEPFTTYTSKEIAKIIPSQSLNQSLKNIDRAIYGNIFDEKTDEALKVLKVYASNVYDEKIKEIKDAR